MSTTLRAALENLTTTENGATSFKSTGNALLDFFSKAAAMRTADALDGVVPLFAAAYAENPDWAVVAAFYLRSIRTGQREREAFRRICIWMAENAAVRLSHVLPLIPEYGRWDDLLLLGAYPRITWAVQDLVFSQFSRDTAAAANGKPVSLLGKYLPSENASSYETRVLARFWTRSLYSVGDGQNERSFSRFARLYRKQLSTFRAILNIPERLMSAGQWDKIDYSQVPSQAMRIYKDAFMRHDRERFLAYLAQVAAREKKINAATLFPYQIIKDVNSDNPAVPALWDAQPNYFTGPVQNVVCVCDTSYSMSMNDNLPLLVATSLTLYCAERSEGPFSDSAIVFNARPSFVSLPKRESLRQRYQRLLKGSGANTDFQAVFTMILDTAVRLNLPQTAMPDTVFCISDMQFDQADGSVTPPWTPRDWRVKAPTNFEAIKLMYAAAGYTMPRFVFWNVRAAADQPVMEKEPGVFLVSGCSPIIFKHALALDTSINTPADAMMAILNDVSLEPVRKALGI